MRAEQDLVGICGSLRRTVPGGQTISPQALVPTAEVPLPIRHLGGAAAEDGSASGPPATTPPAVTAESGRHKIDDLPKLLSHEGIGLSTS